jgi:hypothetical protein
MSSEQLLKIGDVATLLGFTTQTLRNWTNNGYMDAVIGKGGHRHFRRSEVERIMELDERENSIKKCVLYCRVSTSIQKEKLTTSKISKKAGISVVTINKYPKLKDLVEDAIKMQK